MTGQSPFGGVSLLDLFKLEAESHGAALSDGLLALERSPGDPTAIEPLMRAAHSIKGAARIIGLDVIVPLAHAMEDCFIAAGEGRQSLSSGRVDQLLKCVDVIAEVRSLDEADLPAWAIERAPRVDELVAELRAPPPADGPAPGAAPPPATSTGQTAPSRSDAPPSAPPSSEPAAPSAPAASPPPPRPKPGEPTRDAASPSSSGARHVRVASSVLDRMLFLAGESTVEASRLQVIRSRMALMKSRERVLEEAVQSLGGALSARRAGSADESILASFRDLVAATDAVHAGLAEQTHHLDDSLRRIEELSGALYTEVVRSRMRPFSEGIAGFQRMVRDIARELGKDVLFRVEGDSVHVDRDILQKLESPLTHLIRNSLDHGVEPPAEREAAGKPRTATISLGARHQGGMLVIEVRDDGRGIDPEAVRRKVVERSLVDESTAARLTRAELMEMLFLPGFTTKAAVSEISGRGVGLDVVQSMTQAVSGTVTLESDLGRGARFLLRLPVTRSVMRAILVRIAGELFALPLARLDRIVVIPEDQALPVQGRAQIELEGDSIGLVWASDVLGTTVAAPGRGSLAVLVIGAGDNRCGLVVDEIGGEEDLVVRPLDTRLGMVPHLAAAAIRSDGSPLLVIDAEDVWRSVKESLQGGRSLGVTPARQAARESDRRRVLVVDDSITVREVERQLLTRQGYDVSVAVDGKDGFNMLRSGSFDLLVTDVDMPRMTGIELIRAVRREASLAQLPIIIVSYKDREEDRLAGLEAGASAYLTKSSFQDDSLIRMVADLIGAPT
jgi:two-component system sensor histidine kinase and response regulator WspE